MDCLNTVSCPDINEKAIYWLFSVMREAKCIKKHVKQASKQANKQKGKNHPRRNSRAAIFTSTSTSRHGSRWSWLDEGWTLLRSLSSIVLSIWLGLICRKQESRRNNDCVCSWFSLRWSEEAVPVQKYHFHLYHSPSLQRVSKWHCFCTLKVIAG